MTDGLKPLATEATAWKLSRREFINRAAALGFSAAAANALYSTAVKAEAPRKGGHLKIGSAEGQSSDSLDPTLSANLVPYLNLNSFGDRLVNADENGQIEYRLAESVESSADAKTWHFKIRRGVEFHNGKTLTAQDVLRTMERHAGEGSKSGALGVLRGIESMSADGDVFSIELKTPDAELPYLMTTYQLIIQPDGGFDDPAAGIGTGPYILEANEPGVRHLYRKNPNYWDESRGHVDSVEILPINDATARTAALQSGQVHMINRVNPKVAEFLGRAPNLSLKSVPGPAHYVFVMHCDTPPFDNNDLRLALKYAIDREEMNDKILRGYGSIGNDMPVNDAYPLFDETIPQRRYDPELAAEHYRKSGHDGSPIVLRVSDVAFPGAIDAAQLFQQSAKAAGIPLEIKREPADGYWSEVWNKAPFCASYWTGRPVQGQIYSIAYLSDADWNDSRFKNEEFDRMLFQARSELDPEQRKQLYARMGRLVRDEGGVIAPMFNNFLEATTTDVKGWIDDPNGTLMGGRAMQMVWLA